MDSAAATFLIGLGCLAVLIMILGLLSSIIQKWVSDERRTPCDEEATPDQDHTNGEQLKGEGVIIHSLIGRIDTVANAIHRYSKHRQTHERTQTKNEKITIVVLGVTALFAFIAAIAAGVSAVIFNGRLEEMRVDQRAWLAPTGIWHDRQVAFAVGKPIDYVIEFKNVGKTPASHLNWRVENSYFPTPDRRITIPETTFSQVDMCEGVGPLPGGGVIFPDIDHPAYVSGDGYSPPAFPVQSDDPPEGPRIVVSKGMIEGTEAFHVRGCVVYSTMQVVGKSAFCFFVNPYQTSRGPGSVISVQCRNGNSAE